MGRPKAYESERDEVIRRLASGEKPNAIARELGIPKSNIYRWRDELKTVPETSQNNSRNFPQHAESTAAPGDRAETPPSNVTPLEPIEGGQSDIEWVKSGLRSAIRKADTVGVKVQGYNAYLRAIEVEHKLGSDRAGLSNTDRLRRLNQLLGTARTRRTRPTTD